MMIASTPGARRGLACVIGFLCVASAPCRSQDSLSALTGIVTVRPDREPLLGARVIFPELGRWTLTDLLGRFRLDGLPAGMHSIDVVAPNGVRRNVAVTLEPGRLIDVEVELDTLVLTLPEIVVEGEDAPRTVQMGGYTRLASGGGYVITQADIAKLHPQYVSDVLRRIPGLQVDCSGGGGCRIDRFAESRRVGGGCPIQYFLNGVPFQGSIDELRPRQIERIEVYRNAGTLPGNFKIGTAMCGVIAIYSRIPNRPD